MNAKQYIGIQMDMVAMGKKTATLDLDDFLKSISNAETVAPLTDPTLYIRARDNLRAIKNLALAFQSVKLAWDEMQEAILSTALQYQDVIEKEGKSHEQKT